MVEIDIFRTVTSADQISYTLIFLHIQKELSYTNLISWGLLQKQSSFDSTVFNGVV